jgi:hypothetical protein
LGRNSQKKKKIVQIVDLCDVTLCDSVYAFTVKMETERKFLICNNCILFLFVHQYHLSNTDKLTYIITYSVNKVVI